MVGGVETCVFLILPDEMPEFHLGKNSMNVVEVLVTCQLVSSKGEARRLIQQGGVRIDQEKVDSEEEMIDLSSQRIVQVGKRKFARISP